MIEEVTIDGFKSLRNCRIDFEEKTTCLVGLNGAGKSTVLQALGFLSALLDNRVTAWLEAHRWTEKDLRTRLTEGAKATTVITFEAAVRISADCVVHWLGRFNTSTRRCTAEEVTANRDGQRLTLMRLMEGRVVWWGRPAEPVTRRYEGSILGSYTDQSLPVECRELRQALCSLRSMDLLNPQAMRGVSRRDEEGGMGEAGEKIAAYLSSLPERVRNDKILPALKKLFPRLVDFKIKRKRYGWMELIVCEQFGDRVIESEALHSNDGLLRILGIVAELESGASVLCFDEIENGVSADVCQLLVELLQQSERQILLTTHNLLLVNWLPKEAVRLVYKTRDGVTKLCPLAKIKAVQDSLTLFGPGDALLDLTLRAASEAAEREFSQEAA